MLVVSGTPTIEKARMVKKRLSIEHPWVIGRLETKDKNSSQLDPKKRIPITVIRVKQEYNRSPCSKCSFKDCPTHFPQGYPSWGPSCWLRGSRYPLMSSILKSCSTSALRYVISTSRYRPSKSTRVTNARVKQMLDCVGIGDKSS